MVTRLKTLGDVYGASLNGEWDTRKLALADGAAVASFADTSVASGGRTGASVNGAQSDPTKRLTYSATGLNGNPCISGDGSKWLDLANVSTLPTGTTPVAIITLAQGVRAGPGNRVLLQWGSGSFGIPSNHLWGQKGSSNNEPWWYTDYGGGTGDTYGSTDTVDSLSLGIILLTRTGDTSLVMRVNDTQEQSAPLNTSPIGSASGRLFYTTTGDCNPYIGKLGLAAVISRIPTLDELRQTANILLFGWSAQAKLPADNPYRAAALTVDDGTTPTPSPLLRRRRSLIIAS